MKVMVLGCGLTGAQGGVEEEMQLLTYIGVGDTGHVTYIHTYMHTYIGVIGNFLVQLVCVHI